MTNRPRDLDSIGGRIRALRLDAGMSTRELGAKIGVSAMAVSKYENGMCPNSTKLIAMAQAFGVPVEWIMVGWRRDAEVVAMCIRHAAATGFISQLRAAELVRAFDLPTTT